MTCPLLNVDVYITLDKPSKMLFVARWDDDVVFKNCAKGEEARKSRGFINDTLRSEFHKKFMEKYVK